MKKQIALLTLIATLLFMNIRVNAFASDTSPIAPMTITSTSADLSINSSGKASVSVNLTGSSSTSKIVMKVRLQKLNGSAWSTVRTWDTTRAGRSAVFAEHHSLTARGTYRVYVSYTEYTSTKNTSDVCTSLKRAY